MASTHKHYYKGRTSSNYSHIHTIRGVTSSEADTPGHVHHISGVTIYKRGHVHLYSFYTGPAIPLESGGHTHSIDAKLRTALEHDHEVVINEVDEAV